MRPQYSAWRSLLVILLGLVFVGFGCWLFIDVMVRANARLDEWPWDKLIAVIALGLVVAGWAAWQLRLPTPLRDDPPCRDPNR